MKRYLVFSGSEYSPVGGAHDYDGSSDTLEEAKCVRTASKEWAHIFDAELCEIVSERVWHSNKWVDRRFVYEETNQ